MAPIDSLPPPQAEEAIVVTGRALTAPATERLLGVTVLDEVDLHDTPSRRLEQILLQVPGLQKFRRSDSSSSHPTSHGVTLRGLGGNAASRALLVLDGVPQSDPFGGWINWPAFDPAALAEVRIVRGGGGVAHGPGALAGVIELTSSLAPARLASFEFGSREAIDGSFQARLRDGDDRLALSLHASRGDGFIPVVDDQRGAADRPAPYDQVGARLRWVGLVGRSTELQASLSTFHDERSRGLDFTGNRTWGGDASLRLVGRGRWAWSALAYGQLRDFRSSFAGVNDDRSRARRVALQDDVPSSAFGWSLEARPPIGEARQLRIGLDGRAMRGRSHEFGNYVAGEATRERLAGGDSAHGGLFAEYAWNIRPLAISLAGRIDHWRIADGRLDERNLATGVMIAADRHESRSGWLPTGRIAAGIDLGPRVRLRSAIYRGWRLPTLNELFRPFRVGPDATAANADLEPERLAGIDAGFELRSAGGLELEVTGFANRLRGAIGNVTLGRGPGIFPGVGFVAGDFRQRLNLDGIVSRGIEATASWRTGPWRLRAGYGYVDSRIDSSGAARALDGLRPAQTPAHSASAAVGWSGEQADLSLAVRYAGRQYEDDLNRLVIPDAVTFDAFAAWRIGTSIRFVVRGENLLNERVVAALASDGTIERATPRALWVGLRFDDRGDD